MGIKTVIGDKAYLSKENVEAAKNGDYELISRLNSIVTQGNRTKPDEFEFNKDAESKQYTETLIIDSRSEQAQF